MHAALKLQCGRVTGNKKFIIGGLMNIYLQFVYIYSYEPKINNSDSLIHTKSLTSVGRFESGITESVPFSSTAATGSLQPANGERLDKPVEISSSNCFSRSPFLPRFLDIVSDFDCVVSMLQRMCLHACAKQVTGSPTVKHLIRRTDDLLQFFR